MKNISKQKIISIAIFIIILIIFVVILVNVTNNSNNSQESKVNIKSIELKELIKDSWELNSINLGTKESTFDNYDIFFDEGLEIRTINSNLYNIVFTEKYKGKIVNNICPNDSLEKIVAELGEPDFGGKSVSLIGYKLDDVYVFFNGVQASVYPIIETNNNITWFNQQYSSATEFIDTITSNLTDFDNYVVEKQNDNLFYALVNYTDLGIRIIYNNDDLQIIKYNNCLVEIPKNDVYTIVTKNKNLVYEVESERQNSIHNRKYAYEQYQASMNNLPPDFELDEENQVYVNYQSTKFLDIKSNYNETGEYNLKFISINGDEPNSEINQNIISSVWLDDYNIIYSIKSKGIYMYNIKEQQNTIIKEGTETFMVYGITKDNKLEYDDSKVYINF